MNNLLKMEKYQLSHNIFYWCGLIGIFLIGFFTADICVGLHRPGYIENILNIVGLGNVGKKKVGHFSLGMKQRLGIGMALVGEPDVLVLDEPINGLDPEGIAEVRETLLRLNKEKGLTIIISSHILEELSKIATNYAIIDKGQLVKELSREELEATCREHIEIKMEHPDLALPVLDALGFNDNNMPLLSLTAFSL